VQLPAWQAVVSSLVPPISIGNAVALNSAQYNLGRIVAPAVAGVLIAAGGIAIGFWVNAIALAIVAVLLGGLAIPRPRDVDRLQAAMWRDLQDGIRHVAADRVLTILVLLPAVPALFVLNYITFTPVYARDILDTGPVGLGLLTGSIGVGALTGALSLAILRPSGGSGRLLLTGLGIAGASLLVFAESRFMPLSMVALAILGTCQVMYYSTTNTLIQILVPARLRGRVLSLYLLTSIGLIPIANLAGGAIADVVGVPTVLGFGGAVTIAVAIGVAVLEPRIGQLRAEALARGVLAERESRPAG
jgi:MFS family permease